MTAPVSPQGVRRATEAWLREAIGEWALCPFAASLIDDERLRIQVVDDGAGESLLHALRDEIEDLRAHSPELRETTLVVHPHTFESFEAQIDFLGAVDGLLESLGARGEFQVVSFHPQHRFADAEDPADNFANRSPFPAFHILREASVQAAVLGHPDTSSIPLRNSEHLRARGFARLQRDLERWRALAEADA